MKETEIERKREGGRERGRGREGERERECVNRESTASDSTLQAFIMMSTNILKYLEWFIVSCIYLNNHA